MKLYKSPLAIGVFLAISLSGLLYHVKYKVVEIESALRHTNNDIYKTEESIHVLNAELAYYTTPASIQKIATRLIPHDPYLQATYLSQDEIELLPDYIPPSALEETSTPADPVKEDKIDVR